jgi:hypothetical protein
VGDGANGPWVQKNVACGRFSNRIVKAMIGKGCGRSFGPGECVVSALETSAEEGEQEMTSLT